MSTAALPASTSSFARDGYLLAPVFEAAEIAALQAAVAAHMERVARALFLPHAETEPDAAFDMRIERIAARDPSVAHLLGAAVATDAHRAPAVAEIIDDPRFVARAEDLLGARLGDRTIRFRGNSSTLSEHRKHWHSDVAMADGTDCSKVRLTAWIPLTDAGAGTGGLEIATGLRDRPLPHTKTSHGFSIDDALLDGAPTRTLDVPAGSCLFMDRFTPHRALPNRSGRTRWSLAVWMNAA